MATLPNYLQDQTEETIRQRMLDSLPSDLDKSEGSFIWDAVVPTAIELAQAAIWAQEVLRRGFAGTTFGAYLDLRCEEHGLTRRAPVKAKGQVQFTGTPGTVVPAGIRVATPADRVTGTSSVEFLTKASITLDETGVAIADVEAVQAGISGNIPTGSISLVVTPVNGVVGVTNPAAFTGGIDTESDESLLARYLQRVRSPSSSGNKADYINWSSEVQGVGGVSVVPVKYGPGTVSVALLGLDKVPASQELVDAVQDYIAPPHRFAIEAEGMDIGSYGTSIDGTAVFMQYDSGGPGTIRHDLPADLPQLGIWRLKVISKVDSNAGVENLIRIGVWNSSTEGWATSTIAGSEPALITLSASELSTEYEETAIEFYWNGQDQIELQIDRLTSDTSTRVWIDRVNFVSAFSRDDGDGKAPIGARVYVESATAVVISVSVTLSYSAGYSQASVRSAVEQAIKDYIASLAFAVQNDVIYTVIGSIILGVPGVVDYSALTVNGGASNITIADQEVAVPGTVTIS